MASAPTWDTVAEFQPSEHIRRLDLTVDVDRLVTEAEHFLRSDDAQGEGFHTRSITRRPGSTNETVADLSGRYWIRPDDTYEEVPRDPIVDESAYTELVPEFEGSYIAEVVASLRELAPIGRTRLLGKDPFNCNSWHRDPEPRIHIPIVTNPGSLFIINHHVTHLPADGSVYFTDTRAYHTALNGGEHRRISIVAAIAI
ncbi:MAG: hypothetical protein EX269_11880 [Acidimicrobiales bacterium]|nr:MAG: hypothetical protein EX269_11880 [Acidimicrobiales bacterium]